MLAPGWRESTGKPFAKSEKVSVVNAEKPSKKVATIHVVLGLEDKGEIPTREIPSRGIPTRGNTKPQPQQQQQQQQQQKAMSDVDVSVELNVDDDAPPAPRETQEYQVRFVEQISGRELNSRELAKYFYFSNCGPSAL